MSLIGWLTASVRDTTMALVEDGALLGPRQLDMGNSGLEGIKVHIETHGEPMRLSPPMEIATYRIVQETINNVRRHSSATKVDMHLHFQRDQLRIQIDDNGVGFNVPRTLESAVAVGHMGLLGMRQRVESLGGELQIESQEGMGTRLTLQLPLTSPE